MERFNKAQPSWGDRFRELVDQAHAHGIEIIQDRVANHTGPYHPAAFRRP
ncbi:MAG: alpha-amylase family glycosyl hydrolase [Bryobacteraceae bacterium]